MVIPEPPAKDTSRDLAVALAAAAAARAAALWLLLKVLWDSPSVSHLVQDIRTWRDFFIQTRAGAIPYVDITKEYPVLGGVLYWLMSPFVDPDDLRQTVLVHGVFMGALDLLNTALFFRLVRGIAPRHALLATLLFSLNLTALVVGPVRYESAVVTFVLLGYAAHRRGRFLQAAFFWALGCGLKWYPAFFLAAQEYRLFAVEKNRRHWLRALAVFSATTAAINLPFAVATYARNGDLAKWTAPYLFHAERPLYWDTLLGVGQIWLGPLPWERYAGAWSLLLMSAAVLARPRMLLEPKGVLVCLAAIVFNRIYSTQFNLWFYPFLILYAVQEADTPRRLLLWAFVVLDLVNVAVFPPTFTGAVAEMGGFFPFAARGHEGPWTIAFSMAIAARAFLVAALGAWLLARPAPGQPAKVPA